MLEPTLESAESLFARGAYREAGEAYRAILLRQLAAGASLTSSHLMAMERLADIAVISGAWAQAETLLEKLRSELYRAATRYAGDYASLQLASLQLARGAFSAACTTIEQLSGLPQTAPASYDDEGLRTWESLWAWPDVSYTERAGFFARYYLEVGRLAAAEGRYESASTFYKRGLQCSQVGGEHVIALALVLCLAGAKLEQGDLPSADAALDLLTREPNEVSQVEFAVKRLELLAKLDYLRGWLGPAKQKMERSVSLLTKPECQNAQAHTLLDFACLLVVLNQTRKATELCHRVQEIAATVNDHGLQKRAKFLLQFAAERGQSLASGVAIARSVSEMWGEKTTAETHQAESSQEGPFDLPASSNFLAMFEERSLGVFWHLGRDKPHEARTYLEELKLIFAESTDSLLIRTRLAYLDCVVGYYEGHWDKVQANLERICPILRKMGLKPELWQSLRLLSWCNYQLGYEVDGGQYARQADELQASMADTLTGVDRAMFELNKWTATEEAIAAEIVALTEMKQAIQALRGWRRWKRPWLKLRQLLKLGRLLDTVDRYKADIFRNAVQDSATRQTVAPLSILRRLLTQPRDRATCLFVVLPDRLLVVRASWLDLDFGVSSVTRIQIRDWVARWHEAVRDIDSRAGRNAAENLSDALQLTPLLRSLPARVRRVTFVPDDSLHGVPFAALRHQPLDATGEPLTSRWLVEDYALSVDAEWSTERGKLSSHGNTLAVSIPREPADPRALPHVYDECASIVEWLTSIGMHADHISNVGRDEVLSRLPRARLVHMACHGVFQPDQPDGSGLELMSSNGREEVLSIRNLAALDLHNIEHITLSACWSADNFILPGRWIISLPEVLIRSGVRSVLGSLWSVEDNFAVAFTADFYRNLHDGLRRDEALQKSQLRCLRRELSSSLAAEITDPFYWAGFVLRGDAGRVEAFNGDTESAHERNTRFH
jgi:CHAT domain-containing protein